VTIPSEQRAELSDVQLLRRAVTYSRPCGFEVVEKWRTVALLFGVGGGSASTWRTGYAMTVADLIFVAVIFWRAVFCGWWLLSERRNKWVQRRPLAFGNHGVNPWFLSSEWMS
jgi:hypothetical protein